MLTDDWRVETFSKLHRYLVHQYSVKENGAQRKLEYPSARLTVQDMILLKRQVSMNDNTMKEFHALMEQIVRVNITAYPKEDGTSARIRKALNDYKKYFETLALFMSVKIEWSSFDITTVTPLAGV